MLGPVHLLGFTAIEVKHITITLSRSLYCSSRKQILESRNEKISYCLQEEAGLEMLFIEGQYMLNILSSISI